MLRIISATIFTLLLTLAQANAKVIEVKSPNGTLCAKMEDGENLKYSLFLDGTPLLENCAISMHTDKGDWGVNSKIKSSKQTLIDKTESSPFFIKSKIRDFCTEAVLDFGQFSLIVRLYDNAFAFRFVGKKGKSQMLVKSETFELKFQSDATAWIHGCDGVQTSFEEEIMTWKVKDLESKFAAGLPFVVSQNGVKIAVLESDVFSYPSLRIKFDKEKKHPVGWNAKYPKTFKTAIFGRTVVADEEEDFIAKTNGNAKFPWRIIQVAKEDKELLESDLVYKLATPSKIKDTSWIPSGICTWDWMCRDNLRGVDFDPQLNQKSAHYFIDFASKFALTFALIDDGWVNGDAINDDTLFLKGDYRINIKEAAAYAKSKNVKFLLWALAKNIAYDPENSFKMIAENGVAGLKIDFIERDDQLANEMHEKFARIAAKYKLAIFFHGCLRPTGMNRTYPNILSYESVRGNEFPQIMSPEQNVKIAQTRTLVGPLDYTPGVMTNTQDTPKQRLRDILITKGTRASQIALFVMYFSPIQMVCDSPTTYESEPKTTKFLAGIPTVWDETKAINCKMDEYATIARRKGDVWYLAGLTVKGNHKHKENLSEFLNPNEKYVAEIYRDTTNSHKIGMDFKHETIEVNGGDTITFPVANNGGFVIKFTKKPRP